MFAPDGITCYEDARRRGMQIHGYRVCSIEDIIESKRTSNRLKDRESLPKLRDYAVYLEHEPHPQMRPRRRAGAAAGRRPQRTLKFRRPDPAAATPPNSTHGSTRPTGS